MLMKVQIKLLIVSINYSDNFLFLLSDNEGDLKLPSFDLQEGDLWRQSREHFKDYTDLSWNFITCNLLDVKQKKDIVEIYYGIIIPNDTVLSIRAFKHLVGPAEDEEIRTLVNKAAVTL